jgi:hypothetical protein
MAGRKYLKWSNENFFRQDQQDFSDLLFSLIPDERVKGNPAFAEIKNPLLRARMLFVFLPERQKISCPSCKSCLISFISFRTGRDDELIII